jgi:hypothetical protein
VGLGIGLRQGVDELPQQIGVGHAVALGFGIRPPLLQVGGSEPDLVVVSWPKGGDE